MSKDTIKVNMNVYDIPIVVDQLKKLEQENKQLKEDKKKAREYIKFEWQKIIGNKNYSNHLWTIDGLVIKRLLEILGDKE